MELADFRLTKVLDKFIDRISQKQTLSMRKLANKGSEEIQFGRFISNPRVTAEDMEQYLYDQLRKSCTSSHVLLIEDSSQMSFSLNRKIENLGRVDKGQVKGFYLHPVLCMDAITGGCNGIAAMEFFHHQELEETSTLSQRKVNNNRTPIEQKASYRWYSTIEKAVKNMQGLEVRKTVVADRESDIYAVLSGFIESQVDYVIRSKNNRPLMSGGKLFEVIQDWDVAQTYEVDVPATDKRIAHKAKLELKFGQVEIKKAEGKSIKKLPSTLKTWVVEAKELQESVVGKEQPIHWILLTSHP